MLADASVVNSVQNRILLHILCSPTNSLIISDQLEEYLMNSGKTCDFVREEIDTGLEALTNAGLIVFRRTEYNAKEYRHTDDGRNMANQLFGNCRTEWRGVYSLWDSIH